MTRLKTAPSRSICDPKQGQSLEIIFKIKFPDDRFARRPDYSNAALKLREVEYKREVQFPATGNGFQHAMVENGGGNFVTGDRQWKQTYYKEAYGGGES